MGGIENPTMKLPDIKKIVEKGQNKIRKFANSNGFVKFVIGLVMWAVAFIPFYVFLLIRWGVGPEGFWQELALFVVCAVVFGWLQILAGLMAFFLTIALIFEDM